MNKRVYKNVKIGKGAVIDDFVVIGRPPRGKKDGELPTLIGDKAHIRSGTVIYSGNSIGNNFQTGHNVTIRESNTIGNDVSVGSLSCVEHSIKIGDGVRIHSQAFIPEYSSLEDHCWIGPNVVLTNAYHPQCPNIKGCLIGPSILKNAKVGANSTILPGVVIGRDSLIGAGSVVVKDVPASVVAAGNPARVIKKISELKCKRKLATGPYETRRNKK